VSGGATIDTLSGGCISDNAGTSSTTAVSQKALAKYLPLGQPSWSYYSSGYATTASGVGNAVNPFTSASTTYASAKGITWSNGLIVPSVAGRYLLTVTGQVSGNGAILLFMTNTNGGAGYVNPAIWNGTASSTNISGTFLYDFTGTSSSQNYTAIQMYANSGTFTINWLTFTGVMIG
jgi:hypothetical protein